MIPLDEEIERARVRSPEFRKLWDESEFAREVAIKVLRYRTDHGLTQAKFGELVGLAQPAVAQLENGEENPTLKTLAKVSAGTGLVFRLKVSNGRVDLAYRRAGAKAATGSVGHQAAAA